MKLAIAVAVLVAAALAVGQMHPFPGPGATSGSPLTGIVTSGLVAFWDLSTAYYVAGTDTFTDLSGTGNAICKGSSCSDTTWDPGVDANYATYSVEGMQCSRGDSASLSITGDITVEAIVSPAVGNTAAKRAVSKGSGSEYELVLVGSANNKLELRRGGVTPGRSTTGTGFGVWHSVAAVHSVAGASLAYYLDGAADGTSNTGTPSDGAGGVVVGMQGAYRFTGLIARVRIYNRALGSDEITANYNRDKAVLAARGISLP